MGWDVVPVHFTLLYVVAALQLRHFSVCGLFALPLFFHFFFIFFFIFRLFCYANAVHVVSSQGPLGLWPLLQADTTTVRRIYQIHPPPLVVIILRGCCGCDCTVVDTTSR